MDLVSPTQGLHLGLAGPSAGACPSTAEVTEQKEGLCLDKRGGIAAMSRATFSAVSTKAVALICGTDILAVMA